jgi:cell division protein FtsB
MKNNHRFFINCCSVALLFYAVYPELPARSQSETSPPSSIEKTATPASIDPTTNSGSRDKPTTTTGQSKSESPSSSSLWSLGTLLLLPLHIVEIWGIIQLFLSLKKSQRDQEQNTKTLKDENKKLSEELKEVSKKMQERDIKLKKIEKELAVSIPSRKTTQPFSEPATMPVFSAESPESYYQQPETVPVSNYQFLDSYNRNSDSFAQQYALTVVSEDATNINDRRSGDSTDIILSESRNGNYWLVKEGDITYLIPRPKVKIQEHNIRTVRGLFDCSSFEPDYHSFTVLQPAIVSVQSMADGLKWKVEQKGELKFT